MSGRCGHGLARRPSVLRALMALSRPRLLAAAGLSALMAGLSMLSLYSRLAVFSDAAAHPSAGDAIVWLFMGNPLGLASEWAALWCLVLALCVGDVRRLVGDVGAHHVVACGERGTCWRGLCLATAIGAVLACASLVIFSALLAMALGGAATLRPVCIAAASLGAISSGVAQDVWALLALTALGAASFSLLELALSLRLGRPLALAACIALLLGSAFLPLLPLPGSWLAASRLEVFAAATAVTAAWPVVPGVCELVGIGTLAVVLGGRTFGRLEFGLRRPAGFGRPEGVAVRRRPSSLPYCIAVAARPLALALALVLGVTLAQCVSLVTRVSLYAPAGSRAGLADFLAFALLGSAQPDPLSATVGTVRAVSLPFGWLVLVLLPQAWACLFCRSMRRREIPAVLVGSRRELWVSRCVTAGLSVLAVLLVELATCTIATVVTEGALFAECSPWFADVAGLPRETLPVACEGLLAFLFVFSCMSIALVLTQLMLSELLGDLAGLLAVAGVLAASVFLMTPLLPGNYLMCSRSTVFVVPWQVEVQGGLLQAGLDPLLGAAFALAIGVAAFLLGGHCVGSQELLGGAGR